MASLHRPAARLALLSLCMALASPARAITVPIILTHVTLTQLLDGGSPMASGTVCFTPADSNGNPLTVSVPGYGLVKKGAQFCQNVVAGTFPSSLAVPSACATNNPTSITYNIAIQELDASGDPVGVPVVIPAVPNICGASYALDAYAPVAAASLPLSPVVASGVGVPAACTSPSLWISAPPAVGLYTCASGVYVPVPTGASGPVGPPGTSNGFHSALASQSTPGAGDGIAAALAACTAGQPCGVQAEPGYPTTDATVPSGAAQRLVNNATGGDLQTMVNPMPGPNDAEYSFSSRICYQQQHSLPAGGNAPQGYNTYCDFVKLIDSAPGTNYGYGNAARLSAGGWTPHSAHVTTLVAQGLGITNVNSFSVVCAVSDCNGDNYDQIVFYGNIFDGSAEGANVIRHRAGESAFTYYGTLTQGGAGATQLYMTPIGDAANIQDGRFMVDFTGSYFRGVGMSFTPADNGRLTLLSDTGTAFPASTFQGSLLHDIGLPNRLSLSPTSTPVFAACVYLPFSVTFGTLAANDVIAFDSTFHETARVRGSQCGVWASGTPYLKGQGVAYGGVNYTSASDGNTSTPGTGSQWTVESVSAGQILVAADLRQSHEGGSTVFGNGMAGYGIWFDAAQGENGLIYPSEVVGSPDAHTLALAYFIAGSSANNFQSVGMKGMVPGSIPLTSVTVAAGGVATLMPQYGTDPRYEQRDFVTVSGNSNAALNGRYAQTSNTAGSGNVFTATLCTTLTGACVPSSTTGSGNGGGMAAGDTPYGNTRYTAQPIALVLDVNDYRNPATITSQGTSARIEPNPGSWTPGGSVSESHLYTLAAAISDESMEIANPRAINTEFRRSYFGGPGATSVLGTGAPQAFDDILSGAPISSIAGGGGSGAAPTVHHIRVNPGAATGSRTVMDVPPFPSGTPFDSIGFLPDMTKYPHYYTPLFRGATLAGNVEYGYSQGDGSFYINTPGPVTIPRLALGAAFTGNGDAAVKFSSLGIHTQELNGQGCGQRASAYFSHGTGASYQQNWEWGTDSLCSGAIDFYVYNYLTHHNALVLDASDNAHIYGNVYAGGGFISGTATGLTTTVSVSGCTLTVTGGLITGKSGGC